MISLKVSKTLLFNLLKNNQCNSFVGMKQPFHRWLAPTLKELKRRKNKLDPEKPVHRKNFLEWNYDTELYAFSKRLGENFDSNLLQNALTDRSYIINEEEKQKEVGIEKPILNLVDNRELAEKGSKFIDDIVKRYLRTVFPKLPEEGILETHKFLTSIDTLSNVSFHIGTSELVLCADFPVEKSTLANVLKALIGAIIESSGNNQAALFVRDFIVTQLADKDIHTIWEPEDPIKLLKDILSNDGIDKIEPRLIGVAGKNTILACFRVGLFTLPDKKMIGLGFGETVDIAHKMAAQDSLRHLFNTLETTQIPFNLELNHLCPSTEKNLFINEWSTKKIPLRPTYYKLHQSKLTNTN